MTQELKVNMCGSPTTPSSASTKNVHSRISKGNGRIVKHNSQGVVRWFNEERGIGFATDEDTSFGDIFIHRTNVVAANLNKFTGEIILTDGPVYTILEKGEKIEYDVLQHTSGSFQCKNITGRMGLIMIDNTTDSGAFEKQDDIQDLGHDHRALPVCQEGGKLHLAERWAPGHTVVWEQLSIDSGDELLSEDYLNLDFSQSTADRRHSFDEQNCVFESILESKSPARRNQRRAFDTMPSLEWGSRSLDINTLAKATPGTYTQYT